MFAVHKNSTEIIKLLIENGADKDLQQNEGITALMIAVNQQNLAIVRLLIENGADVNIRDRNENYSLDYALFDEEFNPKKFNPMIKQLLLSAGGISRDLKNLN